MEDERMKRIYIAGKYTAPTMMERDINVAKAREAMVQLQVAGFAVFCPHTLSHNLEHDPRLTYEHFMENDLEWLSLCDAMLLLEGWESSRGSLLEKHFAEEESIPVFFSVEAVRGWEQ
jgi:nucleoside 2-deoxyribosyltransferase